MEASPPSSQPTLFDIPASVPPIVAAIYQAAAVYWQTHFKPPSDARIAEILQKPEFSDVPCSPSTVYRARTKMHPEYFPAWPIPRDATPPWQSSNGHLGFEEALAEAGQGLELIARVRGQEQRIPVQIDEDGHLCLKDFLGRSGTALAAAVGGLAILDAADGKMDGIIHWCHVLVKLAIQHAKL